MSFWHDKDDVPKKWSGCAVICITANHKSLHYAIYTGDEFMSHRKINNVQKWAYTEDLINSAFKEPVGYSVKNPLDSEFLKIGIIEDNQIMCYCSKKDAEKLAKEFHEQQVDAEVVALYD